MEKPIIYKIKKEVPPHATVVNAFESALRELFFINHPNLKKGAPDAAAPLAEFLAHHDIQGVWVYYPWRNVAIHTMPEDLYLTLRTSRNRNIITQEEQKSYRRMVAGVVGLSVGSAALAALTMSGGPRTMKIADFDELELTNLNRIRAGLQDIGMNKTHIAARAIWELDPFADLHLWDKGVTKDTLREFLTGAPRLDIFIDEMDSLDLKIMARLICREEKIPVLMATDNGDGVILDVERFDEEPARAIFHGFLGDMKPEDLQDLAYEDWLRLATNIVGPKYLTERMQDSLLEIGKLIPAVPQVGTTATVAGAAISFACRRIASKKPFPSERYTFGFEEKLIPSWNDPAEIERRAEKTKKFINSFGRHE